MLKNKLTIVVSIAALGFAAYGCSSGNSSSPAKPGTNSPAKAAVSQDKKVLQGQAGSLINGNWSCNEGQCSTPERLQISKDLTSFIQTETVVSKQGNNCDVSLNSAVTVSSINDNGRVATINAQILDGQQAYAGDPDDGTDCYDSVFTNDNPDADQKEMQKPVAITITLDRSNGTLSVAPTNNSGPAQVFVKSN